MNLRQYAARNDIVNVRQSLIDDDNIDSLNCHCQSALFVACERGHSEITELLLQRGATITRGVNPLIAAARNGHATCVRLLLTSGASVNAVDSEGRTALYFAFHNKHQSVVQILLENSAGSIDQDGWIISLKSIQLSLAEIMLNTGLPGQQWFSKSKFFRKLHGAFRTGMKDIALRMILGGGRPSSNERFAKEYSFALYYSAKYNWSDVLVPLLEEGVQIDSVSAYHQSETALYCACEHGHKYIVELLVQHGANPNVRSQSPTSNYFSPLQIAAMKGDIEIVRILLDNGALPGEQVSVVQGKESSNTLPIHLAYDKGNMHIVELLVSRGSCIDSIDSNGDTLLHKAAKSCDIDNVGKLLSLGANTWCLNRKCESALHLAIYSEMADCSMKICAATSSCKDNTLPLIENLHVAASPKTNDVAKSKDVKIAAIVEVLLQNGAINNLCSRGETPLYRACNRQLLRVVKLLLKVLKADSSINVKSSNKQPLQIACEKDDLDIVRELLGVGADLNFVAVPVSGKVKNVERTIFNKAFLDRRLDKCSLRSRATTPLITAVKKHNKVLVEFLIQHSADISQRDKFGKDALDYAVDLLIRTNGHSRYPLYKEIFCMLLEAQANKEGNLKCNSNSLLYRVCSNGLFDIVKCLMQSLIARKFTKGTLYYSLTVACEKNHTKIVKPMFKCIKSCPYWFHGYSASSKGLVLLQIAAANGNTEIVKVLIQCGCDVNQTNGRGETALHVAKDAAVAGVLLEKGANINALCNNNSSPLYAACTARRLCVVTKLLEHGAKPNHGALIPLHIACTLNLTGIVNALLDYGADPNVSESDSKQCNDWSPPGNALCISCQHYNVVIVKALLAKDALVDMVDSFGKTPLHWAISGLSSTQREIGMIDIEIIKLLLSRSNKNTVNACSKAGHTALYSAVEANLAVVVELLITYGAETSSSKSNKHPLLVACDRKLNNIAELLLNHSADPNIRESETQKRTPLFIAVDNLDCNLIKMLVKHGAEVNASDGEGSSPLHRAVKSLFYSRDDEALNRIRRRQVTSLLLDLDAHVNVLNEKGETPLCCACKSRDIDYKLVEMLLLKGANPNLPPVVLKSVPNSSYVHHPYITRMEHYPLSHVVVHRNLEIAKLLLQSGAQPNNVELSGSTALHWAVENVRKGAPSKSTVSKTNCQLLCDLSMIKLLLIHGASVNLTDSNGKTVLFKACSGNHVELVSALLQYGADAGFVVPSSIEYCSPLCVASKKQNLAMMSSLLKYGANVNQKDYKGKTALHVIAESIGSCTDSCLDLLLDNGADVNVVCENKESPFYVACKAGSRETIMKLLARTPQLKNDAILMKHPIEAVCWRNDVDLLKILLDYCVGLDNGDSLRSNSECGSEANELPLCIAAELGNVQMMQLLLDSGTRVNQRDLKGNTPLHYVVDGITTFPASENYSDFKSNRHIMFNMLLERGVDVNVVNGAGSTALYKATAKHLSGAVRELLRHGGNPNLQVETGSLLSVACRSSDVETAAVLIAAGADPNARRSADANTSWKTPLLIAVQSYNAELIDLLLNSGAVLNMGDESESKKHVSFCSGNFLTSWCNKAGDIIRLFKAGATLPLLSEACSARYEKTVMCSRLSERLCQAVVFDGYNVNGADFLDLSESYVDDSSVVFSSWLKEDMKRPPSLMRQCRIAVRRQLSSASGHRTIIPLVNSLPIPEPLQLYLKFEGQFTEFDLTVPDQECCFCTTEDKEEDEDALRHESFDPDESSDYDGSDLFGDFGFFNPWRMWRRCDCLYCGDDDDEGDDDEDDVEDEEDDDDDDDDDGDGDADADANKFNTDDE